MEYLAASHLTLWFVEKHYSVEFCFPFLRISILVQIQVVIVFISRNTIFYPFTPSDQPDAGPTSIWQSKNSPNQRTWLVYTPIFKPISSQTSICSKKPANSDDHDQHSFPSWDLCLSQCLKVFPKFKPCDQVKYSIVTILIINRTESPFTLLNSTRHLISPEAMF